MGHEAVGRGAVPVVLAGLEEDAVAGADLLDLTALALAEADALPRADQLALVRRLRERNEAAAAAVAEHVAPYAGELERRGRRFPALAAQLGGDSYARAAEWLAGLEAELAAESAETDDAQG